MKLICLSDTHGHHDEVRLPPGDILIHAGDGTREGRVEEIRHFSDWLARQPHSHKIYVPGNHERGWDDPRRLKVLQNYLARRGIHLLHDRSRTVAGLTVFGTAWQPRFRDWAFNVPRGQPLRNKYATIPNEIDVLITHVPPRGFLDETPVGTRVGSRALRERVRSVQPRVHVFGHVHGAHGTVDRHGTLFVNGAVCGESGRPRSAPLRLTLSPEVASAAPPRLSTEHPQPG